MKEIWKDIKDFEGLYQVSNLGRIKSLKFGKEKILKTKKLNKKSYRKISLSKDGKQKDFLVHRLVAIAFIPNPENKEEVNHIDSNPLNNKVNNLEWCNKEYNMCYMMKHQKELREKQRKTLSDIYHLAKTKEMINSKEIINLISEDLLI